MYNFIVSLLISSVLMSVIALIYMAVKPLLAKRYSEKGLYYVWLVIITGLIIPFRPKWNNAIIKVNIPGELSTPVIDIGNGTGSFAVSTPVEVLIPMDNITSLGNVAISPVISAFPWWITALIIWLTGLAVFIIYHVIKHYRFEKMVKRWSENVIDEQTLSLLENLKFEMKITRQIKLLKCSGINSPMMIGFANVRILLPVNEIAHYATKFPAHDELFFIIKHELIHFKRKDLYYKCLVLIATAIHWFNPIVYLIARAINVQCELSCDAETVNNKDEETRLYYSETIIGLMKYQSEPGTAFSTNFFGSKKDMKKRIFSIMDTSSKKTGISIFFIVVILTITTCIAFDTDTAVSRLPDNYISNYDLGNRSHSETIIITSGNIKIENLSGIWENSTNGFRQISDSVIIASGDIGGGWSYQIINLTISEVENFNIETKDEYPTGLKFKGVISNRTGAFVDGLNNETGRIERIIDGMVFSSIIYLHTDNGSFSLDGGTGINIFYKH